VEARRIDVVRIQTRDQVISMPWKTSQELRGRLLAAGLDALDEQFANQGTSAPVILDDADKEPLLDVVRAWLSALGDEEAVALGGLVGLRDALQADLVDPIPDWWA
jgi:hypothetical protein